MLKKLCEVYKIAINEQQATFLEEFVRNLVEAPFNLTGIRELRSALLKHVIEVLLPLINENLEGYVIDVGTGGGVPAVPISVYYGEKVKVWALESIEKKARFLNTVAEKLKLSITVLNTRAEEAGKEKYREKFDAAFSRALGILPVALELMAPFVKVGGKIYIYGGRTSEDETTKINTALKELSLSLERIKPYTIEGKDLRLLVFRKYEPTPEAYPRRFSVIKKKPLKD
ncbi:MAG: rRNA (guanine527-N7)-methyltransferase [Thermotogota bacterium]|nr:rRNA (guanine527-N7)-methyltransferase [Thermotogota bacterium]MDK2865310.1 rRNA (guanine527-N7)-methyltransferase [Thermotogota bacterium]